MLRLLAQLFLAAAKVGIAAYGGGPSMIPLYKIEVVERYKWMGMDEFSDALAIGNALPGPIATKMSAMVGHKIAGVPGACSAVLGMILPSILLAICLFGTLYAVKNNPKIVSMLRGLRPVVVAMLAYAAWDMMPSAMRGPATWVIGAIALLLMIMTKIHPAFMIAAGAAAGILLRL